MLSLAPCMESRECVLYSEEVFLEVHSSALGRLDFVEGGVLLGRLFLRRVIRFIRGCLRYANLFD